MAGVRRLKAQLRLWRPRWRRANLAALRLFLRILPAERQRVGSYDFSTYPVIADGERFTGMVSKARLRRTVAEGKSHYKVQQLAHGEIMCSPINY